MYSCIFGKKSLTLAVSVGK